MYSKQRYIALLFAIGLLVGSSFAKAETTIRPWTEATQQMGLGGIQAAHVKFVNLNNDSLPDIAIFEDSEPVAVPRLFLNRAGENGTGHSNKFIEILDTGLPAIAKGDVLVFADLNNDGNQDAILGRYLDIYQENYLPPANPPSRSSWFPGKGDGSFGSAVLIDEASLATTRAIAVGDINMDGKLDLFLGNWYKSYFTGYEGFDNDVLLQYSDANDVTRFVRWPVPQQTIPTDINSDLGGRPTYGAAIAQLGDGGLPSLIELNYGRRWNRLYQLNQRERLIKPSDQDEEWASQSFVLKDPEARAQHLVRELRGRDIAPEAGVDGDEIRHGRQPTWPEELTRNRPRVTRPDEPPFRANGNTFDLGVGDIDNDGDFDLFFSTIIHVWAGDSSDRSRFLVNQLEESGELRFLESEHLSVDRLPDPPAAGEPLEPRHTSRQNQGDIYAELADLNQDGRLDLIICSSDYDDEPPFEERLRIFLQQSDGSFADATHSLGIDHVGAGMPTLADVDGDGDLDLLIGQSFNRLPAEQRRAAGIINGSLDASSPEDTKPERRARLFLNTASEDSHSLILELSGDPENGIAQDAFGTIVHVTADLDNDPSTPDVTQQRQLMGPAGHAGKQHQFIVHFGLGEASVIKRIEINWPNRQGTQSAFENLASGTYRISSQSAQILKKL